MKDNKVTFETAKIAKEKGFDIPSKTTYNNKGELVTGWVHKMEYGKNCTTYLAPSQYRLQKWLRNVHNIHISIYPLTDKMKMYGWRINIYQILPHKDIYRDNSNLYTPFDTYEKALEKALFHALTQLK